MTKITILVILALAVIATTQQLRTSSRMPRSLAEECSNRFKDAIDHLIQGDFNPMVLLPKISATWETCSDRFQEVRNDYFQGGYITYQCDEATSDAPATVVNYILQHQTTPVVYNTSGNTLAELLGAISFSSSACDGKIDFNNVLSLFLKKVQVPEVCQSELQKFAQHLEEAIHRFDVRDFVKAIQTVLTLYEDLSVLSNCISHPSKFVTSV